MCPHECPGGGGGLQCRYLKYINDIKQVKLVFRNVSTAASCKDGGGPAF